VVESWLFRSFSDMPRKTKPPKDRTSLIISVAFHAVLIGGIAFWACAVAVAFKMRKPAQVASPRGGAQAVPFLF